MKMTLIKLFAVFLWMCCFYIKTNKAATPPGDSLHHRIYLSSSGSFNGTNDGMTYLFNNNLQYGLKKNAFVLNFNNKWIYGNNPQQLTNNDFNSSLDFNLYTTWPRFYYWGLANFTTSYSLKINEQIQGGLGVAYRLIDREEMRFSISNGILYETSNIKNEESDHYTYQTFRNSLRLQYRISYKDLISFSSAGFYQPSLERLDDYIVNASASLQLKLWKWLSFSTGVTYNHISRTSRENMLVTYGLVAERFF